MFAVFKHEKGAHIAERHAAAIAAFSDWRKLTFQQRARLLEDQENVPAGAVISAAD